MSNKSVNAENFAEEYKTLKDTEKVVFSKVVNKLLGETFLVKEKTEDKDDFYFFCENLALFTNYFAIIDYEVVYDKYNNVCYIRKQENKYREKLTKFDTALILILRQLYYLKRREASSDGKAVVQLEEVIEKIKSSKIFSDDKKVNSYKDSLIKLRKYKVIDFSATNITEELIICILPTIQIIIQQDNLDEITARLIALKKDMGDTEEIGDEDADED